MERAPLNGYRVIVESTALAGILLGRGLTELGAEVAVLETAGGLPIGPAHRTGVTAPQHVLRHPTQRRRKGDAVPQRRCRHPGRRRAGAARPAARRHHGPDSLCHRRPHRWNGPRLAAGRRRLRRRLHGDLSAAQDRTGRAHYAGRGGADGAARVRWGHGSASHPATLRPADERAPSGARLLRARGRPRSRRLTLGDRRRSGAHAHPGAAAGRAHGPAAPAIRGRAGPPVIVDLIGATFLVFAGARGIQASRIIGIGVRGGLYWRLVGWGSSISRLTRC